MLKKLANFQTQNSGAVVDYIYDSEWPHYCSMTFLCNHIVPRITKSKFVSIFFAKTFQFFSQHAIYLS